MMPGLYICAGSVISYGKNAVPLQKTEEKIDKNTNLFAEILPHKMHIFIHFYRRTCRFFASGDEILKKQENYFIC